MKEMESIIKRIMDDAEKKSRTILERGQRAAETLRAQTKRRVEEEKERMRQQHERAMSLMEKRILATARLTAKRAYLEAKEEVLNEAFERAREALQNLSAEERSAYLAKALEKAVGELGRENIVLECAPQDKDLVVSLAKKMGVVGHVQPTMRSSLGGIIVSSKKVGQRMDLSLERMFNVKKMQLREKLAEMLFTDGGVDAEQ